MGAFHDLTDERQITMGAVGAIPPSKIKDYFIDLGYEGDLLFDSVWIIRKVDKHFRSVILVEKAKRSKAT